MAKGGRTPRTRQRQKGQNQLLIGAVVVAVLVVGAIFFVANRQSADAGFYRHVTPAELERVIAASDPVLVYFHSPT